MDFATLLPLMKILGVFAFMLVGIRLKWGLGLSVLAGSFVLAMLFGQTPLAWIKLGLNIFVDRSILTVWTVIILVLCLSTLMDKTKQAERFMGAFSHRIHSPRVRMVFFPALIGLLPMPGGAVFSAPIINAVAHDLPIPEEDKSLINYWFRHCVELTWILFPGLILASGLAGVPTPVLASWTWPLSLVFFVIGWYFFVSPLKTKMAVKVEVSSEESGSIKNILYQGAPIFIALVGAVFIEVVLGLFFPSIPLDYGVPPALALGVYTCIRQNNLGFRDFLQALAKPHVRSMIFAVGMLGVFKNVLAGGGVIESLLVSGTGKWMFYLSCTFLPALAGALTGIMLACVGSVFPIIIALAPAVGETQILPWLMLGLSFGLAGQMMSPLHICFVLSCEYFKVSIFSSWRRLPLPCILFSAISLLYFIVVYKLFV